MTDVDGGVCPIKGEELTEEIIMEVAKVDFPCTISPLTTAHSNPLTMEPKAHVATEQTPSCPPRHYS